MILRFLLFISLFIITSSAALVSAPVLAQDHKAGIGKNCPTATKPGDLATCTMTVSNQDWFGDTLLVKEFWDIVQATVPFRNPPAGNLPIIAKSPAVTCTPAPGNPPLDLVFPCTIPGLVQPNGSNYSITVRSEYIVPAAEPIPADNQLDDQANVIVADLCDVQIIGCSTNDQQQQFGAAVSLFAPSLEVTKTGPDSAKGGDEITYTISFTDTSDWIAGFFPGFENCTGTDTLLGDLGAFEDGVPRDFNYTVQPGDPNPLPNTATITCDVVAFDNQASDSAEHSVDLIDTPIACVSDAECDNGQFCDGAETCDLSTGLCGPGTPVDADDGVGCTDDWCDEVNDVVVRVPNDSLCDNDQFCDGAEICDSINDCQPGTPPCDPATETCEETGDICEPIGCISDAECDDGVFCNGTESCDVDTGSCVVESACPPSIDGCVIRNAICDEDNNVCIDETDDSLCEEGEICLPPDGLCVACDSDPSSQGYWYRQCLGLPASEGGIDPGRNGRGPKEVTEPGFVDVLIPCTDLKLVDLGFFGTTTCEGMDANPPSDDCERALRQLTALILNVCSDRLQFYCPVCIADTCTDILPEDSDVQSLIDDVAEYIFAGMCKEAAELAALANEGEAICVF